MTIALLTLVVLAPLAAALMIAAAGARLFRHGNWLAVLGPLVSGLALVALAGTGTTTVSITWLAIGGLDLTLGLRLDGLSWWIATLVAWVSTIVNVYAVGYMAHEPGQPRFHAAMAFFVGAMVALVLSSSLLLLFVAWEVVGIASFVLIAHRVGEAEARRAASRAFLMTRAGDVCFLLAWLLVLGLAGTTEIEPALETLNAGGIPAGSLLLITLLFFAAAVGKSAQLPLTAWLPDAMVGPTPVSALIHSATMVAAGVYLVLRLFPLFVAAGALELVLWVGAITALLAAVIATAQADLKRVLAWSTVGHLGEMMLALGLGGPVAAAFHLTTHAAFKSALFLTAGVVERATRARDLRALGGRLWRDMPWAAAAFGAAGLALVGLPPLSGFWSEEAILRHAVARHEGWGVLLLVLIALAGVYAARAGVAVFAPWPGSRASRVTPTAATMLGSTVALALAAAVLGWFVATPIERVLSLPWDAASLGWTWSLAAVAASLTGLALGAWHVMAHGPVPAFGAWPEALASAVHAVPRAATRMAGVLAGAVRDVEAGLAGAAAALASGAMRVAGAMEAAEQALDEGEHAAARSALSYARVTVAIEDGGLWRANDRIARWIGAAGQRVRALETGRVYLYTAAIVTFILAGGLAAVGGWLIAGPAAGALE